MKNKCSNKPADADVLTAIMNAVGHTPDTVEGRSAQINLALSAGNSVMVAAVVFDTQKTAGSQRQCTIPMPTECFRIQTLLPSEIMDFNSSWRRWGISGCGSS